MSSSSNEAVETSATSVAIDERMVVQDGNAIRDSLIVSNDPAVVSAALGPTLAAWETMIATNNLNLIEVVEMGGKLVDQIDKSQVRIGAQQGELLRNAVDMFEGLLKANKLNVELIDMVAGRAFDTTDSAIAILAETKTADFADLSKSVMIFALGMLIVSGVISRN